MQNPFGKTVKKETPYEVWTDGGSFTWLVLKKYQTPEKELGNTYARWFLATRGPGTYGTWELGDGYCGEVKSAGRKLNDAEANAFLEKEFPGIGKLTTV